MWGRDLTGGSNRLDRQAAMALQPRPGSSGAAAARLTPPFATVTIAALSTRITTCQQASAHSGWPRGAARCEHLKTPAITLAARSTAGLIPQVVQGKGAVHRQRPRGPLRPLPQPAGRDPGERLRKQTERPQISATTSPSRKSAPRLRADKRDEPRRTVSAWATIKSEPAAARRQVAAGTCW